MRRDESPGRRLLPVLRLTDHRSGRNPARPGDTSPADSPQPAPVPGDGRVSPPGLAATVGLARLEDRRDRGRRDPGDRLPRVLPLPGRAEHPSERHQRVVSGQRLWSRWGVHVWVQREHRQPGSSRVQHHGRAVRDRIEHISLHDRHGRDQHVRVQRLRRERAARHSGEHERDAVLQRPVPGEFLFGRLEPRHDVSPEDRTAPVRDGPMTSKAVLDWLLEEDQPAVRYRTLTELLDRPPNDPAVRQTRGKLAKIGWAAELLARRDPAGWWEGPKNLYRPKYLATNWVLLVLAE